MSSEIRPVFLISDGTGLTAESLGKALLSQFDGINFEKKRLRTSIPSKKQRTRFSKLTLKEKKLIRYPLFLLRLLMKRFVRFLTNVMAF